FVAALTEARAPAVLQAIAEGAEGVVVGAAGPSIRHGLARLAAQVALARAASLEAAREALGESFDVAVEVARSPSGARLRVARIAELLGADVKGIATRDLFVSNPEVSGDAAFAGAGTIPRLTSDFATRGVRLDVALFRRR
ncbi:MAG: hypothetical protein FWD17_17055, partial [Polyangiaceae bacterium]|nr:hypothetical protein [Polyangiaceae bacterium]